MVDPAHGKLSLKNFGKVIQPWKIFDITRGMLKRFQLKMSGNAGCSLEIGVDFFVMVKQRGRKFFDTLPYHLLRMARIAIDQGHLIIIKRGGVGGIPCMEQTKSLAHHLTFELSFGAASYGSRTKTKV
jgi:hypothetical protein